MGGCCGAMKTGQKSLPDKKKPPVEGNQEKSNGKESVAQAVPATETSKAPEQEVEGKRRSEDVETQKQELIVSPVKVSVNASEPVRGAEEEEEPSIGAGNVMDLETAVAPFEGQISNDQSQPETETQGQVAPTDSEFLLPYQIPVQHTFTTTTTTTTKREEFQTDINLLLDEPQFDTIFQDSDVQLSITENFQSSSVQESEALPPFGHVEADAVVKVAGPAATFATPAIPEITVDADEPPVVEVEKTFSVEAERPQEEILPSEDHLAEKVSHEVEVSLPTATSEVDAALEPEPILMICPFAPEEPPIPLPDDLQLVDAGSEPEPILMICPFPPEEPPRPRRDDLQLVGAESSGEVNNTGEPAVVVEENSFSLEAQKPQEDLLPSEDHLAEKVSLDAEVALPTATPDVDAPLEPEPILMICPPRGGFPIIPFDLPVTSAEFGGEVNAGEPVAIEETSVSVEAEKPAEEILPSGNVVAQEEEALLPAVTSDVDAGPEPEQPILMVCPPRHQVPIPVPPFDDQHIAICPPAPADSNFTITELDKHSPEDLGLIGTSDSGEDKNETSHLHEETTPVSLPEEPATLVEATEQELAPVVDLNLEEQTANDIDTAPGQAEQPVVVDGKVSDSAPFEESSAPRITIDSVPDAEPTSEDSASAQPVDEQESSAAVHSDLPQQEVRVESTEENRAAVESSTVMPEAPLPSDDLAKEPSPAAEPIPYQEKSSDESAAPGQEPEPYQEQPSEETASPPSADPTGQVPAPAPEVNQTSENIEATPVLELVSEQTQESRENWWQESGREGGEGGVDAEVPVVELVSGQAQEARQAWWEQNGAEPVADAAESQAVSLEASLLPPVPLEPQESTADATSVVAAADDDDSSIPPPDAAAGIPAIPAELEELSPSSDSFPQVIPEPLPSTFDQGGVSEEVVVSERADLALESPPLSRDGSTIPTENGEASQSSDEAYTPASIVSPEGESTPASTLSPDGVDSAASTKEPIATQA